MSQQDEPGIIPGLRQFFLGKKRAGLAEHAAAAHFLSYLLVVVESVTVMLVFGHTLFTLVFQSGWILGSIAAAALFILAASVIAADFALIQSFQRIPILARNRQSGMVFEHLLYILFVMLIEGSTYAVVIATLDTNAAAILSDKPIIAPNSRFFTVQIILRAVLLGWTTVQLLIVNQPLPVLLATLVNKGKTIVGAHVLQQLEGLDLQHVPLDASFQVYARMTAAPKRVPTLFNGWLRRRDDFKQEEEDRQAAGIHSALIALRAANQPMPDASADEDTSWRAIVTPRGAPRPPLPPARVPTGHAFMSAPPSHPTGGGTPSVLPVPAYPSQDDDTLPPQWWRETVAENAGTQAATVAGQVGSDDVRKIARDAALWHSAQIWLDTYPGMSKKALRNELGCRQEDASGYVEKWLLIPGNRDRRAEAQAAKRRTVSAQPEDEAETDAAVVPVVTSARVAQ